jgi:hypothetical protein
MSMIVGYIVKTVTLCIIKVVVSGSHINVHKFKTKGGKGIMPIKSKRELTCVRCGKIFKVDCEDNIQVKDLKRLSVRFCFKCRILNTLKI